MEKEEASKDHTDSDSTTQPQQPPSLRENEPQHENKVDLPPTSKDGAAREQIAGSELNSNNTVDESQERPKIVDQISAIITWTPRRCRYDPENPPKFGWSLNLIFALATTITVANLYYVQPILFKIAETFDVSFERASSVATLLQAGYAAGLLLICPLGDIFRRRPFILLLVFFTATLACLINFIMSSIFTSFWTTMSFLLSSPPFDYDSLVIGLFALIGIFVICWGPVYSRLIIDKIQPLYSCLLGISIELTGVAIGTFIGTFTVAGPIVEAIVIDLGNQACNIANRTAINDINPKARNRVNTCYMIAAFVGQLTGTAVGNKLYALGGWRASGSFNIGFLGFALIICFVRGPREKGWVGWSGGWNPRKDSIVPVKS